MASRLGSLVTFKYNRYGPVPLTDESETWLEGVVEKEQRVPSSPGDPGADMFVIRLPEPAPYMWRSTRKLTVAVRVEYVRSVAVQKVLDKAKEK